MFALPSANLWRRAVGLELEVANLVGANLLFQLQIFGQGGRPRARGGKPGWRQLAFAPHREVRYVRHQHLNPNPKP